MQEQITFNLSPEFLSPGNPDPSLVSKEIQLQIKSIEDLLVSYHFKARGRVFNVHLDPYSVALLSPSMAKFVVNYSVGQFNACADLDYYENASMEMLLDIDFVKRAGVLTGEYIPEREPDEF